MTAQADLEHLLGVESPVERIPARERVSKQSRPGVLRITCLVLNISATGLSRPQLCRVSEFPLPLGNRKNRTDGPKSLNVNMSGRSCL